MLSFQEFINESGDSHYPYKKTAALNGIHHYGFTDDTGKGKTVIISNHNNTKRSADVVFHDDDRQYSSYDKKYSASGELKHKAVKVFSTVKHILSKHLSDHPHITEYEFYSDKHEPSRVNLYKRMTQKMGGTSEDGEDDVRHVIPVDKLRK